MSTYEVGDVVYDNILMLYQLGLLWLKVSEAQLSVQGKWSNRVLLSLDLVWYKHIFLYPASLSLSSLDTSAAAAKSLQSCPTLCNPIDGSPTVSPISGILQARTLEWVAIYFSNAWKWKWKWSRSVVSDSSRPHGLQPTRLLCLWDFPGKSTGVGCIALIFTP